METATTIVGVILIVFVMVFVLLAPGIIARLIFRNTDEIKLRNLTALLPATVYFIMQFRDGNITDMIDSFSEGLEFRHWAISTSLCLLFFGITYIIQRWCVYWGIGIVDIIRKKSQPGHGPYGENAG